MIFENLPLVLRNFFRQPSLTPRGASGIFLGLLERSRRALGAVWQPAGQNKKKLGTAAGRHQTVGCALEHFFWTWTVFGLNLDTLEDQKYGF